MLLEAIGKLGPIVFIAVAFIPERQWVDNCKEDVFPYYPEALFGEEHILWLNSVLGRKQRLYLFEDILQGPFLIEPFIDIALKAIVPILAIRHQHLQNIGKIKNIANALPAYHRHIAIISPTHRQHIARTS